jgi:hypothetical protein
VRNRAFGSLLFGMRLLLAAVAVAGAGLWLAGETGLAPSVLNAVGFGGFGLVGLLLVPAPARTPRESDSVGALART